MTKTHNDECNNQSTNSLDKKKIKIAKSKLSIKNDSTKNKLKKLKEPQSCSLQTLTDSDTPTSNDNNLQCPIQGYKNEKVKEKIKISKSFPQIIETKKKKSTIEKTDKVFTKADDKSTIFIGNLPPKTTRIDIIKFLKPYCPLISIRLLTVDGKPIIKHSDRTDGGSIISFVQLKDKKTAENALSLNGLTLKNNTVRVTMANITDIKKNIYQSKNYQKRTVFVGNLSNEKVNDDKLREIFSSCGEIEYVRTFPNKNMGCAFVCFKKPESVGLALELKNTIVDNRPIRIDRYKLNMPKSREIDENKKKVEGVNTNIIKSNAILISDLNESTSPEKIKDKFGQYGEIESIDIIHKSDRISALVRYKNHTSVNLATKIRNIIFNMKCVRVDPVMKKQKLKLSKSKIEKNNSYRGKTMDSARRKGGKMIKKKTNNQMEKLSKLIAPIVNYN